jgi:energy-coupling factor transporter ATP-binding protein EcfA2
VQLDRVEIDEADCFRWQAFPVTPLTLIFGANGTGKSTILEVVSSLLTRRERRASQRPPTGRPPLDARLILSPSHADVPDHPDASLLRAALTEALLHPRGFWAERGDELAPRVQEASVGTLTGLLAALLEQAMLRWGLPPERAKQLADDGAGSLCLVYDERGARLSAAAVLPGLASSADGLYFGAPSQDPLGDAVSASLRAGLTYLPLLPPAVTSVSCEQARPHLIVVSLEPTDLLGRLRGLVEHVHDGVFRPPQPRAAGWLDPTGAGVMEEWPSDPWLEPVPVSPEGDARSSLSGPRPSNLAYRERDTYRWVLQQVSRRANELAPSFVTERGVIELSMWPPSRWTQYPERVRVTLEEGGERVDLRRLGSGVARWVAASIRLACDDLTSPVIRLTRDGVSRTVEEIPPGLLFGLASGLTHESVTITPGVVPGVVLVDEPEAHLHPAAIRSVAEWLTAVSARSLAVFVTTHHPILFEARTSLTTRVLVSRPHPELPLRIRDESGFDTLKPGGQGSEIRVMEGDILGSLGQLSDEIGLTTGELFLLTQLCLFVEGPHDVAVFAAFGKGLLDAAGVRVIPLHGADGTPALVNGEVVGHLGLRSCLVLDGGSPGRLSRERKAADRLLEEARRHTWDMTVIQLDVPDILWWLDPDICREFAPDFPGWPEAWSAYESGARKPRSKLSSSDFKTTVIRTYGLQLSREGVEAVARRCQEAGRIPADCERLLHRVAGLAMSGRVVDPPGWTSQALAAGAVPPPDGADEH